MVVDKLESGLVEDGRSVCLPDSETNSIGETLTKGTGGDFNAGGVMSFWVAWGDAVDLLYAKISLMKAESQQSYGSNLHGSSSSRQW